MAGSTVLGTAVFTAQGQSKPFQCFGLFNMTIFGTPANADGTPATFSGTVQLERSFGFGPFVPVSTDGTGTIASYTTNVSVYGEEVEPNVQYRFNCTNYVSGIINCRVSASNLAAFKELI